MGLLLDSALAMLGPYQLCQCQKSPGRAGQGVQLTADPPSARAELCPRLGAPDQDHPKCREGKAPKPQEPMEVWGPSPLSLTGGLWCVG